ncbi:restriction endonuclease subunit S [Francisella tularensis subsp. novicida]|nr:restriction endonuclease subunit S [Francisella tularensis subsp. novicida]
MSELYKLPAGWEWKKLGEVFDVKDGTHDSPKYKEIGYPLVTSKNLKNNSLDLTSCKFISNDDFIKINQRSKVDKGDLLFAMIGTIGSPTIVDFEPDFAIKNVALFKPSNTYLIELLKYWLSSHLTTQKMLEEAKGATQKFVGLTYLRNFPAPLPPLAEQKRIVAKLDSLFEKIDKAIELHQQNITNANTLMASALDKTFKKLEREYSFKILDCLSENIRYGYTDKAKEKGNARFIRITDINDQGKFKDESVYVDIKNTDLDRYKLLVGDILVARSGATAGKVALFTLDEFSVFASYLIRIRLQIDKVLPSFIFYFCYSSNYWNQLDQIKIGGAQPNVNATNLKNIKIPLPPLPIQQQTVEYLDSIATKVDKIKQLNEQKLENLKALKASILDKAFRGEL